MPGPRLGAVYVTAGAGGSANQLFVGNRGREALILVSP